MKIVFEVETHSFIDAGIVEELLKKNDIKFSTNIAKTKRKVNGAGNGTLRRARITKIEVAAVVSSIKSNPNWGDTQVSKATGVSSATVYRIRGGTHRLQKTEAK